jgi:threonine dehydratase
LKDDQMADDPVRLPTWLDVEAAVARIAGHAHRTPVLTSRTLDERTGARLFLKCENFQRAGSFKFRGAFNAIAALSTAARNAGVAAFSSGNHAQAVALAARLQGVTATVVMPHDAPAIKVAATRGYGAQLHFYDRYSEDREAIARRIASERGLSLIPSYDHPDIIAGQGTAARELFEAAGQLDLLLVSLGGGGLLAGSALAAERLAPGCEVVGVEPEAGDDGRQSLRRGHVVHIAAPRSIADGALVTHVGRHNFPIIQRRVRDIVTVADASLAATMALLAERLKIVVEPTGCLALAAALSGVVAVANKRVGVLLSGGNVDLSRFVELISGRLGAEVHERASAVSCA